MGDIYETLGRPKDARRLRREARELFERVNDKLWWEAEGTYALGLNGKKRQIRVRRLERRAPASSPGSSRRSAPRGS